MAKAAGLAYRNGRGTPGIQPSPTHTTTVSLQPLRAAAFALGILASAPAGADASTLKWPLPLPAGHPWRIVDLREGNGIRHEEYVPRGQGSEDYRDRILVQRMPSQDLGAEAYLTHVSAGLRTH